MKVNQSEFLRKKRSRLEHRKESRKPQETFLKWAVRILARAVTNFVSAGSWFDTPEPSSCYFAFNSVWFFVFKRVKTSRYL